MARVESTSVIINGAGASTGAAPSIADGKEIFELPNCVMLNLPNRLEPLAIATARCSSIAVEGLLRAEVFREGVTFGRSLLADLMSGC